MENPSLPPCFFCGGAFFNHTTESLMRKGRIFLAIALAKRNSICYTKFKYANEKQTTAFRGGFFGGLFGEDLPGRVK
jgi:hypothetical protein